ncbi:MAG: nucleotidyltransferase domain-containing protein [Gemmataceae bacterium]
MSVLRRDEAIEVLRRLKAEFAERYGVTGLGVFGSVARDNATEASDVDVVVEMTNPDLFFMVHIKEALEEEFHRPVDVVSYGKWMSRFMKNRIDQEGVYV